MKCEKMEGLNKAIRDTGEDLIKKESEFQSSSRKQAKERIPLLDALDAAHLARREALKSGYLHVVRVIIYFPNPLVLRCSKRKPRRIGA
jgi:hypothetical protein